MRLRHFLAIVELRTKVVSLSGLLIGSLAAWLELSRLPPERLPWAAWAAWALMAAAALAVDMGTTAFNSFFGYWDGSDDPARNRERDKVLVHEAVAPGAALLVGLGLFALAAVLGLWLAFLAGWWIVPVGAACMLVGFLYNGGPLPIARTPFGELFAGGCLGTVLPALTQLVLAAAAGLDPVPLTGQALAYGLPSGLMVASILTVNNTCDIEGDTEAGRRTLSILLGRRRAAAVIPLLGLAALAAVGGLAGAGFIHPAGLAIAAAAAFGLIPLYRGLARAGYTHATKGPSMGRISRIFLLYSLAYAAILILTVFLSGSWPAS